MRLLVSTLSAALLTLAPPPAASAGEVLTLRSALRLAAHNVDVEKSALAQDSAAAGAVRAWDHYVPDFAVKAGKALNKPRDYAYLGMNLTLFDKGKDINEIALANSNETVAGFDLKDRLRTVRLQVLEAYLNLALARQQLRFLREELSATEALRSRVLALSRNRSATHRQARKIQQELLLFVQRNKDLVAQEIEFSRQLRILLNLAPDAPLTVAALPDEKVDAKWLQALLGAKESSVRSHAPLQALHEKIDQMGSKRWLAFSDQLPKLYLSGDYGYTGLSRAPRTKDYTVSVNLEIPIPLFDLPFMFPPISRQLANETKALEMETARTSRQYEAELEARVDRLRAATEQITASREVQKLARLDQEEEKREFLVGSLDTSDYISTLAQNRNLELSVLTSIRNKDYEFYALQLLTNTYDESR